MKVVITGGAGFIGLRLAQRILEIGSLTGPDGSPTEVSDILLFDQVQPAARPPGLDERAHFESGDISDRDTVSALIDRDDISVFHLASVVSGGGEKDFDLAMRVNLDGGRNILEACRARAGVPRLVFASSIAVFGGAGMPDSVGDRTKQTPQTTYGITKSICELLINDYSRKAVIVWPTPAFLSAPDNPDTLQPHIDMNDAIWSVIEEKRLMPSSGLTLERIVGEALLHRSLVDLCRDASPRRGKR